MFRFKAKRLDNQEMVEGYYYQCGEKDYKSGYIIPAYGQVVDTGEVIEVDPLSVTIVNTFPLPGKKDVYNLDKKSIHGMIYNMRLNLTHHDDLARLILELAMLTLDTLSDNMNDDETLEEYFKRASINIKGGYGNE